LDILIVSQYFWPEQFLINDLSIKIRDQGHSVSIFTGKPNYPDGLIYPGYTSAGVHQEFYAEDIDIFRVPMRPRKNGGVKNLMLNYFSFVLSGLKHSNKFSRNKEFDVILVFGMSPITAAIPAILLKWTTRSHLAIWVQDLWPESIEATGFIRNKFLLNCIRFLVRVIYHFSDTILVQSKAFIPQISKLTSKNKVIYYPNSVKDVFSKIETSEQLPSELVSLLESSFCVVFAGNIGKAQSVDTIVKAAEQFKDITNLKIVLVGSGSKCEWIKKQVCDHKMNNLVLTGQYPSLLMPLIFSKASALLVTLKRDEIFSYTIPSKVQSYLAAGKPIIAALNGAGAKIIQEARAGLTCPAEDWEKLANIIKTLYYLPKSKREEMGRSGRSYFLEHFEMENQTLRLIEILENRLETTR